MTTLKKGLNLLLDMCEKVFIRFNFYGLICNFLDLACSKLSFAHIAFIYLNKIKQAQKAKIF